MIDREPNRLLDIHWYKIESSNHNATSCPKRCFSIPVPKEDFWRFSPFHPMISQKFGPKMHEHQNPGA